jgi:hypothetical protein
VEARVTGSAPDNLKLVRAPLLPVAQWGHATELMQALFELPRPTGRTLGDQDRLVAQAREKGRARRQALLQVRSRLVGPLGVPEDAPRVRELDAAVRALRALEAQDTESHAVLTALLEAWPAGGMDAARKVVTRAGALQEALAALDDRSRTMLSTLMGPVPGRAAQANGLLQRLADRLAASELALPLSRLDVDEWGREAQALVQAMLAEIPPPPRTPQSSIQDLPPATGQEGAQGGPTEVVLEGVQVMLGAAGALDALWARLRTELEGQQPGEVDIQVVVRRK